MREETGIRDEDSHNKTTTVIRQANIDDLVRIPAIGQSKIVARSHIAALIKRQDENGELVILTNGCFDLLHLGHVKFLKAARALGTKLVVAVDSDASARRVKGPMRPILPEHARAEMVSSLNCVDYVFIFDEPFVDVLRELGPKIYAKGGDYVLDPAEETDEKKAIVQEEREIVEDYGGKVWILDVSEDYSTTMVIKEIVSRFSGRLNSKSGHE